MYNQTVHHCTQEEQPPFAYERSCLAALITGAVPHRCYANARHALIGLPEWFREGYLVEGWIVFETLRCVHVVEHSWCVDSWGEIIDPSIVLLLLRTQPVFFFAGIQHSWEEMQTIAGSALPLARSVGIYGEDGMGHPAYQSAYAVAHAKALALACSSTPAKEVVIEPCISQQGQLVVYIVSSQDFLKGER